ncbi:hypothetical protein C9374_005399 [Naegleria lovaniensis]|uniref:Protein phosphatase n=1 Tax=Naegleria lovaniensis TaxID=51637 RepID=A0AA88GPN3_NAELO|nr:uncharacterized protein C9374_005399 [Naegleria lovaniensis]KAG2382197.1 hypothetical protein C9374_005399 [Naegleria lovaniensis]
MEALNQKPDLSSVPPSSSSTPNLLFPSTHNLFSKAFSITRSCSLMMNKRTETSEVASKDFNCNDDHNSGRWLNFPPQAMMIQAEEEAAFNNMASTTPTVSLYGFFSAAVGLSKRAKTKHMERILNAQSFYPNVGHSDQVGEKSAGEDAYFQSSLAIGVGDGVGGWAKYNVDPSLISRSITSKVLAIFLEKETKIFNFIQNTNFQETTETTGWSWWGKSPTERNPKLIIKESPVEILSRVFADIKTSGSIRAGSTTFSMVMISDLEKGIMQSLNVGDSGFVIIRDGMVVFRSKTQQHRFNAPYQLTICPPERNGSCIENQPRDGDLQEHKIQDGDIIVMGTDGLFDNLFDWQILQVINQGQTLWSEQKQADLLKKVAVGNVQAINELNQFLLSKARQIATLARVVSLSENPYTFTPFSKAYTEATGRHVSGGKPDDITVIVAMALKRKLQLELLSKNQDKQ